MDRWPAASRLGAANLILTGLDASPLNFQLPSPAAARPVVLGFVPVALCRSGNPFCRHPGGLGRTAPDYVHLALAAACGFVLCASSICYIAALNLLRKFSPTRITFSFLASWKRGCPSAFGFGTHGTTSPTIKVAAGAAHTLGRVPFSGSPGPQL